MKVARDKPPFDLAGSDSLLNVRRQELMLWALQEAGTDDKAQDPGLMYGQPCPGTMPGGTLLAGVRMGMHDTWLFSLDHDRLGADHVSAGSLNSAYGPPSCTTVLPAGDLSILAGEDHPLRQRGLPALLLLEFDYSYSYAFVMMGLHAYMGMREKHDRERKRYGLA